MNYSSFQKLARKLEDKIIEKSQKNPLACFQCYVPNGPITPSVRLACALRYFSGASMYDLMDTFGIGHTDASNSIWYVVDAISDHPNCSMHFPTDHDEQQAVAAGFECAQQQALIAVLAPSMASSFGSTDQARTTVRIPRLALANFSVDVSTSLV